MTNRFPIQSIGLEGIGNHTAVIFVDVGQLQELAIEPKVDFLQYLSLQIIKLMLKHDLVVKDAKVLVMGITFKEDCPDIRNTKVVDLIKHLNEYRVKTTIYDPWANPEEVLTEYGITTTKTKPKEEFDMLILAVAHKEFIETDLSPLKHAKTLVYDVKGKLKDGYTDRL